MCNVWKKRLEMERISIDTGRHSKHCPKSIESSPCVGSSGSRPPRYNPIALKITPQ